MTHAANAFGREQAAKQMGWWWLVVEACMYVIGALIYAVSWIPKSERVWEVANSA
jgi:adiponectin receptor